MSFDCHWEGIVAERNREIKKILHLSFLLSILSTCLLVTLDLHSSNMLFKSKAEATFSCETVTMGETRISHQK